MMQGGYTAALGIASQQRRIDTIASNLANVNTNGFKASRVDFKDALYENLNRAGGADDTLNLRRGHGTLVSGIQRIFTQGQYNETGVETDVYLSGSGFFTVQAHDGEIYYTRDGHFKRSVEAGGTFLVTSDGNYVLGTNGQRLQVGDKIVIDSAGNMSGGEGQAVYAQLRIVDFPNETGLEAVGSNLFTETEGSGAARPVVAGETIVIQGSVEGSNVELAQEFSRLVRASRAFQFSSRALSVADEMDQTAIQSRR